MHCILEPVHDDHMTDVVDATCFSAWRWPIVGERVAI